MILQSEFELLSNKNIKSYENRHISSHLYPHMNYQDCNGNTLLHLAVRHENVEIVKLLLEHYRLRNENDSENEPGKVNLIQQTPFQMAYENGLMEIC